VQADSAGAASEKAAAQVDAAASVQADLPDATASVQAVPGQAVELDRAAGQGPIPRPYKVPVGPSGIRTIAMAAGRQAHGGRRVSQPEPAEGVRNAIRQADGMPAVPEVKQAAARKVANAGQAKPDAARASAVPKDAAANRPGREEARKAGSAAPADAVQPGRVRAEAAEVVRANGKEHKDGSSE
jgi:hypothetical protein